ncbi:DUF2303 family protein [Escherichia coli]|nr:DUF2303 family protein [Escherichia coli]
MGFDANGDAIQATKAAAAVRKITIEANQTTDFKDNDFSGKRSPDGVCRKPKTKDIMPVAFEFKCVPFEGLKERPFKLRLSTLSLAIVLYWFCALFSWKQCRKKWLTNFVIWLVENSKRRKVETFIGTFTA